MGSGLSGWVEGRGNAMSLLFLAAASVSYMRGGSCVLSERREQRFLGPELGRGRAVRLVNPLLQHSGLFLGELGLDLLASHCCVLAKVDDILPREELEVALCVRLTAEVTIGCGHVILGLAQLEIARKGARSAVELKFDDVGDLLSTEAALLSAVSFDEERERLGDANRVRELNECALTKSCLNNRLRHPTARVCGGAVNLRGVLTREGATTVRTPAAIGIDDDLATGKAGVSLRTANDELARGIDVQVTRGTLIDGERWLPVLQFDLGEGGNDHLLRKRFVCR